MWTERITRDPPSRGVYNGAVLLKRALLAIRGVPTGGNMISGAALLFFRDGQGRIGVGDRSDQGRRSRYGSEGALSGVHFPFTGEIGLVRRRSHAQKREEADGSSNMLYNDMSHEDMLAPVDGGVKISFAPAYRITLCEPSILVPEIKAAKRGMRNVTSAVKMDLIRKSRPEANP